MPKYEDENGRITEAGKAYLGGLLAEYGPVLSMAGRMIASRILDDLRNKIASIEEEKHEPEEA